jgi:hypothetical protein
MLIYHSSEIEEQEQRYSTWDFEYCEVCHVFVHDSLTHFYLQLTTVPDEERIPLIRKCLSPPARSEQLTEGNVPFATAAPLHAQNQGASVPLGRPCVIRVTTRHTRYDQVRLEHLDLGAQCFLKPPSVQKHGVGASPMICQSRILLDDLGGGLGHAPIK